MEEGQEAMSAHITALYAILVVFLVVGSGLMSGLTLGLLSLDVMDLEVLRVSGTVKQQLAAARLIPLVAKPHWLLCTLLLCNAACMEALPLFLDRLLNPVVAILLSVTAILLFGEIIPQAVCSRYGVAIGSTLAPLVRVLMLLCAPITWPLGKLLDLVLGHENVAMKRQQLKAMVQLHGEGAGLGGKLTAQEVSVISGAIDLRYKTAISAMTPLSKVFMVSEHALLDEGLVRAMLHSGHSRVPVYRGNDPTDFAGLILVKEVLQFWRCPETPRVSQLSLRPCPRLPADTPMFDMLRFFQTGNSHMALLTAPEGSDLEEFKRTRAFMMTHDEDDSTRSSCSSSSTDSTCSSDDDGGVGTRGSITSSIRRHLRRRRSKCASTQRDGGRSSIDRRSSGSSKDLASITCCSDVHSLPCLSTCSCPCHHLDSRCLCGMTVMQPGAIPGEHLLPGTACTAACSSSSGAGASADAEAAVSGVGGHRLGAHRLEPLMLPSSPGSSQHGGSIRHSPEQQQQQQQLEVLSEGMHTCLQSCPICHCPCRPGRQLSPKQQQQHAGEPVSQPVEVHLHYIHHRQHQHTSCHLAALPYSGEQQQQQQQQQQQESQAGPLQQHQLEPASATGPSGANHVALSIAALEVANSHSPCATHSTLRQASSSSSGSSSLQPGTAGTSPGSARQAAAAAAAEISEGGAAAVGADEMQDKLGPLMTHSLTGGQQLQLLSPAGVLSAAGVRQVPVGIITLEDVIEELMQAEIVDETDAYMDNDKTKRVDLAELMESLPPTMLNTLRAEMLHAAQKFIKTAAWSPGAPALNPNGSRQLTAIRAVAAATAGTQAPLAPSSSSPVSIAAKAAAATAAGSAGGWGEPGSFAAGQAGVGAAGVHIQPSPTVAVGGVTSSSSSNNLKLPVVLGASTSASPAAAAAAAAPAAPSHPSHAQAGKPLSVDALLASASGLVRRLSGTSSSTNQPSTEGSALGLRPEAEQWQHKLQRVHSGSGAGVGMSTAAALSQYSCTDASIERSSAPLAATPGLAPASPGSSAVVAASSRVGGGGTVGVADWGSAAAASAGASSTRVSAPGVLYAGVRKPVAKVFKSAPSPLLSPQTTQEQPPAQQQQGS